MTCHLRDATPEDTNALAALHVQTFNETHKEGRSGGPTYELREQQWRDSCRAGSFMVFCLVIEDDQGARVGFAKGTRRDGGVPGFLGACNTICLLRRVQRQGLGRLLLYAATARFRDAGVTSMLLFGNTMSRANGLYAALGAERLHAPNGAFQGGYGWRDLEPLITHSRMGDEDA